MVCFAGCAAIAIWRTLAGDEITALVFWCFSVIACASAIIISCRGDKP
jgi:hypothetical protein